MQYIKNHKENITKILTLSQFSYRELLIFFFFSEEYNKTKYLEKRFFTVDYKTF